MTRSSYFIAESFRNMSLYNNATGRFSRGQTDETFPIFPRKYDLTFQTVALGVRGNLHILNPTFRKQFV